MAVLAVGVLGCGDPKFDCEDAAACAMVEEAHGIEAHDIIGWQSRAFVVEGTRYHLVHVEYGAPNDCPAGCFYSHYCAVVADGVEYPAYFWFTSRDEHLFDPTAYCPDATDDHVSGGHACAMPALELPLFSDERFIEWVRDPADVNDELRWCRNDFALGYHLGALPR